MGRISCVPDFSKCTPLLTEAPQEAVKFKIIFLYAHKPSPKLQRPLQEQGVICSAWNLGNRTATWSKDRRSLGARQASSQMAHPIPERPEESLSVSEGLGISGEGGQVFSSIPPPTGQPV